MNINSHLLGDLLKSMGIISGKQLEEVLQVQNGFVSDPMSAPDINRAELITKSRDKDKDVPILTFTV